MRTTSIEAFLPISLILMLIGGFSLSLQAQAPPPGDEKNITAVLDSFTTAYSNLPKSKDKSSVLSHISKDLSYSIFNFSILGKSRMQEGDYKGFESYVNYLVRTSLTTLRYDVSDVRVTHTSDKLGVVTYKVDYETKEENGIWVKGKETITMAMEKRDDTWQIVHYAIIQIEDEKLKGTCLCELFASSSEEGELVARTTIPTGQQYTTKFDNFEFKTSDGETLIKVKDRDEVFKRLASGVIVVMKDGKVVELGIAKNKRESVGLLVRDYFYKERCARLKIR